MATVPSTPPRIGPRSAGIIMTPEEFDAITNYDDRYRYELIHGVLVVSPIPGMAEGDPNEELGFLLRLYKETHPQGGALDLTAFERYVYLADSRRRADRLIWAESGRLPDIEKDVPTIVAEFVSKGKRDRHRDYEEKRREYLELGVQEYWVIDRFHRTLTVFKPGRPISEPRQRLVVPESETYVTPLLPGFELPLGRLLAVADRWR